MTEIISISDAYTHVAERLGVFREGDLKEMESSADLK